MTMAEIVPRKVLLVAQRPSDFTEMRRSAVALHEAGWTVQFLYFALGGGAEGEIETIDALGEMKRIGNLTDVEIECAVSRPQTFSSLMDKEALHKRLLGPLLPVVSDAYYFVRRRIINPIVLLRNAVDTVKGYKAKRNAIAEVLNRLLPDAILLPEDVVGAVTPQVIKAGHERNIPTVILPYTIANQQEAFRSLSDNPSYRYSFWPNFLIARLFPRWIMRQDGIALVRLPAPHIFVHELNDIAPPDPWMMNSSYANAIAVENEAMLDYYRRSGIPESKMQVVGAVYDDHLAGFVQNREHERAVLRDDLGIDNKKPLLVIGGCPDQSSNAPPGFEFADMDDFCLRFAATLAPIAEEYQIIFRSHPNYSRFGDLMEEAGILVSAIDTARLVALSDLYIAFASATIRWAVACTVPSINYDVFHYQYDDYRDIGSVVTIEWIADLEAMLTDLRPGSQALIDLRETADKEAGRWGVLDGRATERIAGLIDSLCRLDTVPRTSH